MKKICRPLLEKQGQTHKWHSSMDLIYLTFTPKAEPKYQLDILVLADLQELFNISSVQVQDVVGKIWWMIGMNGERVRKPILTAQFDDDN